MKRINTYFKVLDSSESNSKLTSDDVQTSDTETVSVVDHSIFDINIYVGKKLNDAEKIKYLENIWIPGKTFSFPSTEHGKKLLKFQYSWLEKWNWLAYSKVKDGAYCKYCVLFSQSKGGKGNQPLGQLCTEAFNKWKHAVERFNNHEKTNYHQNSVIDCQSVSAIVIGKSDSVYHQLNKAEKTQKENNRKIIIPVIDSVLICGRQGIALRGHRESGVLKLEDPIINEGNFRALLRFFLKATATSGDESFILARENCGRNAQYISWKIQNEIVSICYEIISSKIVNRINESNFFSIIADETADISGTEQFALCVRYYDKKNKNIREDFLKFIPVHDVSGKSLANHIITELKKLNVDVNNLRGQGYDGAASMSGRFNGVAALIKNDHPSALYVHCSAHNLNLSVSSACNIQGIRNTMNTIETCYNFFNTPKRQQFFSTHLDKLKQNESSSQKQKLKRLCPTRWIERYNSIETFYEFFPAILNCLEEIIMWNDSDTSSKANQLLLALQASEFNVALTILNYIFQYTHSLCKYLQTTNIDLVDAIEHISLVKKQLMSIRENVSLEFNKLYNDLNERLNDFEIKIEIPRLAKRQKHRINISTNDPEEYFKIALFIPFLDSYIQQLNDRFINHKNIISGFQMLMNSSTFNEERLKELVEFYSNDIDSFDLVKSEILLWNRYLDDSNIKTKNAINILNNCNSDLFPNVFKLLQILVTLPVTSCEAERSFSTLKRIKTYLRNSTSESRLNGLAALNIHYDIDVKSEEVIQRLSNLKRRLDFIL